MGDWRRIVLLASAGSALNLIVALVGTTVLGLTFAMPAGAPNPTIPLPLFAVFTMIAVLLGAAIARFLIRYGRRAVTVFILLGFALAILSIALPFGLPITAQAALVMAVTHVIGAITFVAAALGIREAVP